MAPSFSLKDQDGKTVSLSKFKGKPVVVYFYPADETPGCTKQVIMHIIISYEKYSCINFLLIAQLSYANYVVESFSTIFNFKPSIACIRIEDSPHLMSAI